MGGVCVLVPLAPRGGWRHISCPGNVREMGVGGWDIGLVCNDRWIGSHWPKLEEVYKSWPPPQAVQGGGGGGVVVDVAGQGRWVGGHITVQNNVTGWQSGTMAAKVWENRCWWCKEVTTTVIVYNVVLKYQGKCQFFQVFYDFFLQYLIIMLWCSAHFRSHFLVKVPLFSGLT